MPNRQIFSEDAFWKRNIFKSEKSISMPKQKQEMVVKSSRMWDVKFAANRRKQFGSSFVSQLSLNRRKMRRISLEVMSPKPVKASRKSRRTDLGAEDDDGSGDIHNELMLELLSGKKCSMVEVKSECTLLDGEKAVVRVFKHEEKGKKKENGVVPEPNPVRPLRSDDGSISTLGFLGAQEKPEKVVWTEEHCYNIEDIEILSRIKNTVVIRLTRGKLTDEKILTFGSSHESRSFFRLVINFQKSQNTVKTKKSGEQKFPSLFLRPLQESIDENEAS